MTASIATQHKAVMRCAEFRGRLAWVRLGCIPSPTGLEPIGWRGDARACRDSLDVLQRRTVKQFFAVPSMQPLALKIQKIWRTRGERPHSRGRTGRVRGWVQKRRAQQKSLKGSPLTILRVIT